MLDKTTLHKFAIAAVLVPGALAAAVAPGFAQNMQTHRSGFGHGNEVNTRQGNQQSRISQGVRSGAITPGGDRNLQNRENSIHNEAQADRAANGGRLTSAEKAQINARQNRVSQSIYNDKHNGINDSTAAAHNGTTAAQEHQQAVQQNQATKPRGPLSQPPQ